MFDDDHISRNPLSFQIWREQQWNEWSDHLKKKSDLITEHWDPCPKTPDELASWIAAEFFDNLTYHYKVARKQSHWRMNGYPIDPVIVSAIVTEKMKKHIRVVNRKLEGEVTWWLQNFLYAEDQ